MKSLTKFKIVEIEEISYIDKPQNVYDITVEDNESYTANSYIVHNCTTSANASVHYPMASLIYECNSIRQANGHKSKIVADGGFKNFSDIIKGLALGADYIMLGGILNKCLDSDSHPYLWKTFKITNMSLAQWLYKKKFSLYKRHVGMSTKEIQKVWGNYKLKTSEGIAKWNKIEYTFDGWVENFNDYLKTTMSYLISSNLED